MVDVEKRTIDRNFSTRTTGWDGGWIGDCTESTTTDISTVSDDPRLSKNQSRLVNVNTFGSYLDPRSAETLPNGARLLQGMTVSYLPPVQNPFECRDAIPST